MFSVASLLNPVKPESRGTGTPLPSSPSLSMCASSPTHGIPQLSTTSSIKKTKMTKDGAVFAKGKIKGDVNYPPFENLSEETKREVQKFQVYPLGKIELYCRHIPYNSEKKSFLEKTGRESFEVFQYIFKVPGDDKDYTVMWDYNIGLVRITPFFKCCKYSKTTPAKMLNLNPGLKDITHSITGGALAAQGYWMPYSCALQVCATFCAHIAPALIPIFGPSFPSLCVPPEAPEHGRMIIDSSTILSATADAEAYRMQYQQSAPSPPADMRSTPPIPSSSSARSRLRLKRTFGGESSYTDTDGSSDAGSGYFCSPATPSSSISPSQSYDWRPQNHNMISYAAKSSIGINSHHGFKAANPILSAIPRSIGLDMSPSMSTANASLSLPGIRRQTWRAKRRVEELNDIDAHHEDDVDYDGEESSASMSIADEKMSVEGDVEMDIDSGSGGSASSAEKKAAWLLMKLSVKDRESSGGEGGPPAPGQHKSDTIAVFGKGLEIGREEVEEPRIKRRRATSM